MPVGTCKQHSVEGNGKPGADCGEGSGINADTSSQHVVSMQLPQGKIEFRGLQLPYLPKNIEEIIGKKSKGVEIN